MTRPIPHVSDHALIRYLERVVGIDVAAHRRAIEQRVAQAVELGASAVVSDGFRYAISDFRVTTVAPAHHEPRQSAERESQTRRCPDCRRAEGQSHLSWCPHG